MRAVQEGVFLIRVANTGISAIINNNGKIVKKIHLNKKGILDQELVLTKKNTVSKKIVLEKKFTKGEGTYKKIKGFI